MAVGTWLRQSAELGQAPSERESSVELPLVFLYQVSSFDRDLRRDTLRVVAIVLVTALGAVGLFAAQRAGLLDVGDLLREILGPFYRRFLAMLWIGAGAAVLGGLAWVVKRLGGGDDYGIEIHHDGVVWMRRPAERYPVPWSNIGRIWRLPIGDVDAFELVEPLQVSVGPARWKRLEAIPFSHLQPGWRWGTIGAALARYAPHLLDLAPPPTAWTEDGAEAAEEPFTATPRLPRIPYTVRFRDTVAFQESIGTGRFLNRFMLLLALLLTSLLAGHALGFVEPGVYARGVGEIADLPDFFSVAVFAVLGVVGLGVAVIVFVWACVAIADLRGADDDWGIEFGEEGFVFLSGESGRAFVPWTDVKRIEHVPVADFDEFDLVRPFTIPARFGPPQKVPDVAFGMLDKHWRSGPIGAVLRRYAPHLFDDGRSDEVPDRLGDDQRVA